MLCDSERIKKSIERPFEIIKSALTFRVFVRNSNDKIFMLINCLNPCARAALSETFCDSENFYGIEIPYVYRNGYRIFYRNARMQVRGFGIQRIFKLERAPGINRKLFKLTRACKLVEKRFRIPMRRKIIPNR